MRRLAILTLAGGLLLAACGGQDADTESGPLLPRDRLELPTFDLEEYRAMIAELEGTPVVVNFWGSWCPPCRAEAPHLQEVSKEYEGRVQFIGVDILDNREAARDFILASNWQYPSVFDPMGAIRDGLGYVGQPITLVYDPSGELSFEWNGAVNAELLREEIGKVLGAEA